MKRAKVFFSMTALALVTVGVFAFKGTKSFISPSTVYYYDGVNPAAVAVASMGTDNLFSETQLNASDPQITITTHDDTYGLYYLSGTTYEPVYPLLP